MEQLNVKIEIFEGPLDLLLHLVKKNQVDIYDIPISVITEQYLGYLKFMKSLNIDLASEYLVLAATLVNIKSRMLLASPKEDPREEITQALVDYIKVRDMADVLEQREILHRDVFARYAIEDIVGEKEFIFPSIFDLLDALKETIEKTKLQETVPVELGPLNIEEKMREILSILEVESEVFFERLFNENITKEEMIVTFLALLHLAKEGEVILYQASPNSSIYIKRILPLEEQRPHLEAV